MGAHSVQIALRPSPGRHVIPASSTVITCRLDTLHSGGSRLMLEGASSGDVHIGGLLGGELGELGAQAGQVQHGHLLVQVLGQHVHLTFVAAGGALVPQLQLGNHLHRRAHASVLYACGALVPQLRSCNHLTCTSMLMQLYQCVCACVKAKAHACACKECAGGGAQARACTCNKCLFARIGGACGWGCNASDATVPGKAEWQDFYLVGEGAGHDERGVASGAAQVEQAALSQDDHTMAVGEDEAVTLGLDVLALDAGPLEHTSHVDLRAASTHSHEQRVQKVETKPCPYQPYPTHLVIEVANDAHSGAVPSFHVTDLLVTNHRNLPLQQSQPTHLVIEVADVAHDGVVLHLGHVVGHDDVLVAGGGDEDVGGLQHILQGSDLPSSARGFHAQNCEYKSDGLCGEQPGQHQGT
eukprot:880486-Pelagomonas_calceolata.AAC.3